MQLFQVIQLGNEVVLLLDEALLELLPLISILLLLLCELILFNLWLGSLLKLGTLRFPEFVYFVFVARKHSNEVVVSNQNAKLFLP